MKDQTTTHGPFNVPEYLWKNGGETVAGKIGDELAAKRADVLLGMNGDANRVRREAQNLADYLTQLIARLPILRKDFDIDNPEHYNAILRMVESVEGAHVQMRRIWDEPHAAGRAQLILIDTLADRIKEGGK